MKTQKSRFALVAAVGAGQQKGVQKRFQRRAAPRASDGSVHTLRARQRADVAQMGTHLLHNHRATILQCSAPQQYSKSPVRQSAAQAASAILLPGGEKGPVTFPAFKAVDTFLRGTHGGFDSHTPPPSPNLYSAPSDRTIFKPVAGIGATTSRPASLHSVLCSANWRR